MMDRRKFIREVGTVSAGMLFTPALLQAASADELVILHTNDWHSRIEPFPMDGGKLQGLGGAAKRAALISEIRKTNKHVLLLDSGDIFQGTPYFNVYGGELEFKLMSEMGYDVATLGNHDFDAGIDGLLKQLPHAGFDFVNANYDFSDTALAGKFSPYKIIRKGPWKIGVYGVGIELNGLVPDALFGGTRYLDPIAEARKVEKVLKEEEDCDLVICLSHLGYNYSGNKVSDHTLAAETENTDLILGGHTHTFLTQPTEVVNKKSRVVIINQAGWAGVILGRLDIAWKRGRIAAKPRNSMLKVS